MLNLIGDKNSLDAWPPKNNTVMIVLLVNFTSVIKVHLFLELLNIMNKHFFSTKS
jgi:hypothetical protein